MWTIPTMTLAIGKWMKCSGLPNIMSNRLFIKIKCHKNVLYFIDTRGFGHIVGNLSNKMAIFPIYHSVYKHLYEDVNVAQKLQ